MVTVKVVYKNPGKDAQGKKVALYVSRFMAGGVTDSEWTDSCGEAHFDVESGGGEVYAGGSTKIQRSPFRAGLCLYLTRAEFQV